ncbi:hypothetical protein [Pseudoalteromonas viridis]|uniref:Uncharacterized protein n=1 Tax=Pseudoalteromonas viridis TaxID=339617 RepID=A0ABX7V9M8_9GAMM|nr:hypothetical protein [Pseudoalteromonas viridis]QTL36467.1 hypothetical protein J5X90_05315 [Pseudoalteromonas viridis]
MSTTYSLFAVLIGIGSVTGIESVTGVLRLQEPAREFYYASAAGTVVYDPGISLSDKVTKGQVLLTYIGLPEQSERTVNARSEGYIEYVNEALSDGERIDVGEMLYKVKSNRIFGWYQINGLKPGSFEVNSQLWVCKKHNMPWRFNIDAVQSDGVLVSSLYRAQQYSYLYAMSQQKLVMYYNKRDCLNSIQ